MTEARPCVALVTGCSSGIGMSTALALAGYGCRVYATARRIETLEPLKMRAAELGLAMETRVLDVSNLDSIEGTVSGIAREAGRLDIVVNNAGYALFGALEDIPFEDLKREFDTNVFGLILVSKAAIPIMRNNGGGTIVNVSSVAGRVAVPIMGAYCASKFSVEAFSLAMNAEARQFGIRVVMIEPGPVDTKFSENAIKASGHIVHRTKSAYAKGYLKIKEMYENGPSSGVTAERVARVIVKAIRSKNPKTRYAVRLTDRLFIALGGLVSTRLGQRFMRGYFGLR